MASKIPEIYTKIKEIENKLPVKVKSGKKLNYHIISYTNSVREKCPNPEVFLVRIFPHSN